MAIEKLNQGTPTAAAQIPFHDVTNGQDRRASVADILALATANASSGLITQYAAPNANAFSVSIAPPTDGTSMWLLLTPAAGYAAGTIVLPALATCQDGQELLVSCNQAVAALTVDGNGSTVNGAPASLAANGFFRLRFDGVIGGWYRVG